MVKQPMFYKINCDIAELAINHKLIAKIGYWNNEKKKKTSLYFLVPTWTMYENLWNFIKWILEIFRNKKKNFVKHYFQIFHQKKRVGKLPLITLITFFNIHYKLLYKGFSFEIFSSCTC
jgi:hypothetical protein